MTALPSALDLTRAQYSGWACVRCHASLQNGAVPAGRARGSIGAHALDVDVYQCKPGHGCNQPRGTRKAGGTT
ncbi:hypothetical protein [Streptomyces sp. HUAS TT20]|uniref:hypothetical protein n=1 Tax=Streptomyces sp. HUAS TT20 TaxID=3447509 RepID=UPI0021D9733A|nr:hypothetical protein [Streptomyces sp. HUAS 15-9]UXY28569.1 hypothetical protein N8I87_19725 [Streptomyces sp. HUAS 15-9]